MATQSIKLSISLHLLRILRFNGCIIAVLIFGKGIEMEEAIKVDLHVEDAPVIGGLPGLLAAAGIFIACLGLAAAPTLLHHFGFLTTFWEIALTPISLSWAFSIGLGFYNEISGWKSPSASFVLYANLISIVATVATVSIVLIIELGLFAYDLMIG
jgi:hypothetical protein